MAHAHAHDNGIMFGHHDARYNAEKIVRNLILLQDHYISDPCGDCVNKHLNTIIAYAEEGLALDEVEKVRKELEETIDMMNRHLVIVMDCVVGDRCEIKSPKQLDALVSELRTMRRKLNLRIYGIHGDVTHDFIDGSKLLGEPLLEHTALEHEALAHGG